MKIVVIIIYLQYQINEKWILNQQKRVKLINWDKN